MSDYNQKSWFEMGKEFAPRLEEGALGSKIVQFFKDNGYSALPVHAEYLSGYLSGPEINYRLTFDDETVADCKFIFEDSSLNILSVEEYNRVI